MKLTKIGILAIEEQEQHEEYETGTKQIDPQIIPFLIIL